MKKINVTIGLKAIFLSILIIGCKGDEITGTKQKKSYEEIVVVANRGSESISFIDANSEKVIGTLTLQNASPMYVVYLSATDKLYIGDRAGSQVHIVNPITKLSEGTIKVGNGVFHMWANETSNQLWVNSDIDNIISVIDLKLNKVIKDINLGIKPHDIFLSKDATRAYVSVIDANDSISDKIFMYSTSTFRLIKEVNVGKDPHLFHLSNTDKLFVPCKSGQVYTLDGKNLNIISNNAFEGAHGIFSTPDEKNIFVTNLSGGQIYSIDSKTSTQNGNAFTSLSPIPHNIVINKAGNKMFVTHSGTNSETVSTYSINSTSLTARKTIKVGKNPFGLAYYRRLIN